MNKVLLIGRLTNDIELRYTANQTAVASFALAINRGKDRDGNDKGADFPRCIAFSKTAETLSKYCEKAGDWLSRDAYRREATKSRTVPQCTQLISSLTGSISSTGQTAVIKTLSTLQVSTQSATTIVRFR